MFSFFLFHSLSMHAYLGEANSTYVLDNKRNIPIFVRLFASWCPHCKQFNPVWEELIEAPEYKNKLFFASIECEQARGLCKKYFPGENYPRIYWWDPNNHTAYRFMGERSISHVKDFINKQFNFPLIEVNDSEIEKYKQKANVTTSFIFNIKKEDDERIAVARNLSSACRNMENAFLLNDSEENSFKAFIGSDLVIEYKGEWNVTQMQKFVEQYSIPFMATFTPYLLRQTENMSKPILVVMNRNNSKEDNTEILKNVKDAVHIASSNCVDSEWLCRYTSTYEGDPDVLLILVDWKKKLFWIYKGEKRELEIRRWINDCNEGRIKGSGPGRGLFSGVKQSYYDFLAGGKKFRFEYILYVPGLVMIVFIWILTCRNNPGFEMAAMEKTMARQRFIDEMKKNTNKEEEVKEENKNIDGTNDDHLKKD